MTEATSVKRTRKAHNCNFGKRNPRMARLGNGSARKSPPWLESYNLDTFAGVDAFTKELLRMSWTGKLGTRQSGNCLAILRLLLERRLWLPMTDRYNPETGRFNDPSPEHGKDSGNVNPSSIEFSKLSPEEASAPRELSPEAQAAIAAIKKTVDELRDE